jgi:filamentous hemagglutinin family protein
MENTHWKTHRQSLRGHSDASGLPTPPRPPKDGSVQRIVADRCGGFGLKKWTALATALVFTWSMCVSPVMAETINLEGGSVEVNTQENTTNWNVTGNPVWNVPEFNVPQNSIYNITGLNQNASLALLVNGGQATNIFGTMNLSNLDFILQNIAGINIGSTGMINLNNASILASTIPLNLNVTDFLAHDYQFSGQGGFLMNDGKIVGNNADLVALIANAIENQGTIEVPMGTVAFAAGNTVTVGISGDGLVSIGVDEATANTMGLKDQIKNTGTITADGGKVILNAQAMDGLFEKARYPTRSFGPITAASSSRPSGISPTKASSRPRTASSISIPFSAVL